MFWSFSISYLFIYFRRRGVISFKRDSVAVNSQFSKLSEDTKAVGVEIFADIFNPKGDQSVVAYALFDR